MAQQQFIPRLRIALLAPILMASLASAFYKTDICTEGEFKCDGGRNCLPTKWVCDGFPDCKDKTDEMSVNCKREPDCHENEWKCGDGKCIPGAWRCDGDSDCIDDEENCAPTTCGPANFLCGEGKCVSNFWRCDGTADCDDGSDELNCGVNATSAPTAIPMDVNHNTEYFYCDGAHRLPLSYNCDGDNDCKDGTDEKDCDVKPQANNNSHCLPDSEFECSPGYCVLARWVCDGSLDCANGKDELDCPIGDSNKCDNQTHFQCRSGACVRKDQLCDGKDDCIEGEDERTEQCEGCSVNNGGCDQICTQDGPRAVCRCRAGYKMVGPYSCQDVNECLELGSCSQLCSNTEGSFHCSCSAGYSRHPDNPARCKASQGEKDLLFSHGSDIRKLRLSDESMMEVVGNTLGAGPLDYHFERKSVVWGDTKHGGLYRSDISGGAKVTLLENVLVDGIAVDWVHNTIYYTSSRNRSIGLITWDAKFHVTIVKEKLHQPRAIAVSPTSGFIYWTDWGTRPRIERASLDGSHRQVLVQDPHVVWPNGITLDHVTNRVFWCDARHNSISSANFDGTDVQTVLYSRTRLPLPHSISVFEDRIYWTDLGTVGLYSADKFTGNDLKNLTGGHMLESPRTVVVLHPYRQPPALDVCSHQSCSHICVRSRYGAALCLCPDGLKLGDDTRTCHDPSPPPAISVVSVTPVDPVPVVPAAKIPRPVHPAPEVPTPVATDAPVVRTPKNRADIIKTRKETSMEYTNPEMQIISKEDTPTFLEMPLVKEMPMSSGNLPYIIVASVAVVFSIVTGVAFYIVWNRGQKSGLPILRFQSPVYRKTTDDQELDGRGFTIAQEEMFGCQSTQPEADDAPLTPEDDDE